ncbi:MAG: hypothetical protein NTV32_08500 [Gammaproteobacteria bacterium]|nr:hypothetical protein [Gammaproteobacteria bacterium]
MKKLVSIIVGAVLIAVSTASFAATLTSMNKIQVERVFTNQTLVSIGTDNLNGKTIDNTFSMFLDGRGHIWGKMAQQPAGQPQTDQGVYSIAADGIFYITWQHWDDAARLCGHLFETDNAYISVDCSNVFHTAFMKADVLSGNHLNYRNDTDTAPPFGFKYHHQSYYFPGA